MALDFPANPTDGQVYGAFKWSTAKGVWQSIPASATVATASPTAPVTANPGDIWFNSSDGTSFVYYSDGTSSQWVEIITTAAVLPYLDNITDVVLGTLTDGNSIYYDLATASWKNSVDSPVIKYNKQTISSNYTLPTGYNGVSSGPITIANGVIVTIPDGTAWSIV